MKAKKRLGQHFLIDNTVIDRILETINANCNAEKHILEVGPGPGILTFHLNNHFKSFKAVEFDRDMIALLKQSISEDKLIAADFLKVNLDEIFNGEPFSLVGNFPYNISSQIIFKMLEYKDIVPVMVGMFQKEVAERICAVPGNKQNGILSLNVQAFYNAKKIFDIGPEAFNPPPRVNSSIVVLTRKNNKELSCDHKMFSKVIKTAFQQRRKKMRNTLKMYGPLPDDDIFQKRPEQLGVEEFVTIVNKLKNI